MANVTDFSMVKNAAGRAKIYSTSLWAFYFCLIDFMVPYMFVCLFFVCNFSKLLCTAFCFNI